ncbi:MAG: LPS-assembly protein LptD [Alphaproteobacteria bacterium]|nr:LPS-assembly protein LptD [Alphaproteobacteria bacterium]
MLIINRKIALFWGCLMLISFPALAVTEAGEIVRQEKKSPDANVYITNNITDLGNITATDTQSEDTDEVIDFSADEMINDDEAQIITAQGNVEILYSGMKMTTDKVIYNQNADTLTAMGNVKIYTQDGSIIESDSAALSDNMTIGEMNNIKVLMRDKSHVTAKYFVKKNNRTKVMRKATYTACDVCEGKSPIWHISAHKVQHNEDAKNVYYNHALVYFKSVPFFYTPFLTHPDPTVKRRSGLLAPTIGSSNYLDAYFQPRFFWAVNDQTNILFSPIYSTEKDIVWNGGFSHYFTNAFVDVSGSYLDDNPDKNDKYYKNRPKHRGHLFAHARADINDYWRMTTNINYTSDYIYLKDLDLPHQDDAWLVSDIKFERFSGRDYVSIESYYYKLLSYNLHRRNVRQFRNLDDKKPFVAPLVEAEIYSDPKIWGSYFKNNFSTASVYHQNGSQTQRLTSINAWELPYTTSFGDKYRFVTSVKSDAYYVNRYPYQNNDTYTGTTARIFPQAGVEWHLPFIRATETSRQIVEPVIVGVVAPDGGNKVEKIPNEDSEDVYLDDTNVLDLDRYAGYDRNDTGSRISYGMRWNSYGNIFGKTSAFIAQSFERKRDSSFIQGLDNQDTTHFSDLVGRINASPNKYLSLNYRFRLDKDNLNAKYSELGAKIGPSLLSFDASYIFLQGNTYYNDTYSERKELYTSLSSEISQYWKVKIYNLKDLTKKHRGRLEHGGSVIYDDECFTMDLTFKKYNTSNPNLDNDYELGLTFSLKTIGSFGS